MCNSRISHSFQTSTPTSLPKKISSANKLTYRRRSLVFLAPTPLSPPPPVKVPPPPSPRGLHWVVWVGVQVGDHQDIPPAVHIVHMVLLGVVGEEEKVWPLGGAMVVMAAMVTESK